MRFRYLLKSITMPGADRLARQTGAAAARNDRPAVLGGPGDRGLDVGRRARDDDGQRPDLIDAGIGAVERPVIFVAVNFARNAARQVTLADVTIVGR